MSRPYPLPSHIHSNYSRYKSHTQHVLRWIHTTAASLVPSNAGSENIRPTPTPKSRGKGKSKRTPKPGANRPPPPRRPTESSSPVVSIGTLLKYARSISEAGLKAPKDIIDRIASIIQHRKLCAAFYSSDADAMRGNAGHHHVIRVYVEILELLGRYDEKKQPGWIPEGKADYLAAMVDALSLGGMDTDDKPSPEEVAAKKKKDQEDWLKDNPFIQQQLIKKKKPQEERLEVPNHPLEAYVLLEDDFAEDGAGGSPNPGKEKSMNLEMAVTCFFSDCAQVRQYVGEVWKSTAPSGPIARATASLVNNQAVEIVRMLEKQLYDEFSELKTARDIYEVASRCFDPLTIAQAKLAEVEEGLMMATFQYICEFGRILQDKAAPVVKDDFFPEYNPKADRAKMDHLSRRDEDMSVLMTYLPEYIFVFLALTDDLRESVRKPHIFAGDDGLGLEVHKYWKARSEKREVTMPLVFAAQLFLDTLYIRRAAGVARESEVQAMRAVQRQVCKELESFEAYNDLELRLPDTIDSRLPDIAATRAKILKLEMGSDVAIQEFKKHHGFDQMSSVMREKDWLWIMNPWLCGNATTYALMELWDIGTAVCGGGGFINSAMALWNMVKQTGNAPPPAQGALRGIMDHLIDTFTTSVFRSSRPPRDMFAMNFYKMQGSFDSVYAGGHCIMGHDADIYTLYEAGQKPSTLQDIFDKQALEAKQSRAPHSKKSQKYDSSRLLSDKPTGRSSSSATGIPPPPQETSTAYSLHSLLLLSEFENANKLRIKWIGLHLRLLPFFRRLWKEVSPIIGAAMKLKPEEMMEREDQLSFTTGWIMHVCDGLQDTKSWSQEAMRKTAEVVKKEGLGKWAAEEFMVKT